MVKRKLQNSLPSSKGRLFYDTKIFRKYNSETPEFGYPSIFNTICIIFDH